MAAVTLGAEASRSQTSRDYRAFMRSKDPAAVIETVTAEFTRWLGEKGLQQDSHEDARWASDSGSGQVQRETTEGAELLRCQLVEPGTSMGTWTTEVLAASEGWIDVSVSNSQGRFVAVPRLAKALMRDLDLRDASLQLLDNVKLWDVAELDMLVELLQDPDRHGLVLVAGTGPDPGLFDAFRARIHTWTREVFGLAQSIVLTPQATWALAERLSFHAVPAWTLRTYYPGVQPLDAIDSRRHRYMSTATLATEPDAYLRSVLGNVARAHAARRPEPIEVVEARRALDRAETAALLDRLDTPTERPSVTLPGRQETGETRVQTRDADTLPETRELVPQADVMAAIREILRLDEVSPETVRSAFNAMVDQVREAELEQIKTASLRIKEQAARIEELEDRVRLSDELLDDDILERALLQDEATRVNAEVRWLRARLREKEDYEAANGAPPDEFEIDYPQSCLELLDRIAEDDVLVFTGDREEVAAVDEVDTLQLAARAAWDACTSLREYARAHTDGKCSSGVDHFLRHRPAGYEGVSPGKHGATETGVTMRRFGGERVFAVPAEVDTSRSKTMTAHFKLARIGLFSPRLYYYDDLNRTGKIYIGYLGRHLTNTQTN
ncbi:hypothetical protein N865_02860 [Intrasporangium oryzae NRRL B-24470]|uniref:Uncharacterized protein n=1 Tax=Intrasporangium oryzae NRRL B-24470 TaxID=1386089 RepID=W9GCR6_9MICO|nr:hypothetical protein [Intrasporangium oryzae]EWT02613.1 hypothetical protein N865_02860 [Intrasporangium oryzae NRRL B-24470]